MGERRFMRAGKTERGLRAPEKWVRSHCPCWYVYGNIRGLHSLEKNFVRAKNISCAPTIKILVSSSWNNFFLFQYHNNYPFLLQLTDYCTEYCFIANSLDQLTVLYWNFPRQKIWIMCASVNVKLFRLRWSVMLKKLLQSAAQRPSFWINEAIADPLKMSRKQNLWAIVFTANPTVLLYKSVHLK